MAMVMSEMTPFAIERVPGTQVSGAAS